MSSQPVITASYSVATPAESTSSSTSSTAASEFSTFAVPVTLSADASSPSSDAQTKKEHYLTALAAALSTLQESINTGLTERLVQQGVLSESTADNAAEPGVNTKLRTKVPGQPNNSKKGQTKKQQQRENKEARDEQKLAQGQKDHIEQGSVPSTSAIPALEDISLTSSTTATTTATDAVMEVEMSASGSAGQDMGMLVDGQEQYKPKGGIYGDEEEEEEANQHKDEVDLVMEADPGEVDGACLELPKEESQHQQHQQQTKKRNELPTDHASEADLAAAKKSRGD